MFCETQNFAKIDYVVQNYMTHKHFSKIKIQGIDVKKPCKKCLVIFSIFAPVFIYFLILSSTSVYLVNTSDSMPLGLYKKTGLGVQNIERGSIVLACSPSWMVLRGYVHPSGRCSTGGEILKTVFGVPGDTVFIRNHDVYLNGIHVFGTTQLLHDNSGRSLPLFSGGTVQKNEFFLLSPHNPRSADGRYFGFTKDQNILGVYKCVICLD